MVKSFTTSITPAQHADRHRHGGADPLTGDVRIDPVSIPQYSIGGGGLLHTNAMQIDTRSVILVAVKGTDLTSGLTGTISISFMLQALGGATATAEIWRSGVKVGTTQTRMGAWLIKSENIGGWAEGDTVEIRLKSSHAAIDASVKDLKINGYLFPVPDITSNDP